MRQTGCSAEPSTTGARSSPGHAAGSHRGRRPSNAAEQFDTLAAMLDGGSLPCFAPSRRFVPYPWRVQPLRLPRALRILILIPLWLAALAIAAPLGVAIVSALF